MSTERDALNKLALGRGYVLHRAAYIASTLLELTPVILTPQQLSMLIPSGLQPTMGVTKGLVLYVNGEWLLSDPEMQGDDVVGGCLYHECEHPLRGMERLEALHDGALANIAGDLSINFNLREEGWALPSWAVYPEQFNHPSGLTLEQHYELLIRQQDKAKKGLQQFMDDCMNGKNPPSVDGDNSSGKKGKGNPPGGQEWQKKVGAGACGGAAGNPLDQLEDELDAEFGKGAAEVDAVRRATLDAIEEHIKAHGCGSLSGRFDDLLKTRIQQPMIDWRRELRRIMRKASEIAAGATNYSMRRPSIGGALVGVASSGLISHTVRAVIAEDTSLSMGEEQLLDARSEGYNLLKKLGLRDAWHIQFDAQVQRVNRVKLRQLPNVSFRGRGGTDFRPLFEKLSKLKPRPNLVVIYTDGDGPAPVKPPPGVAVVFCIVRTPYARKPTHWGHIVVCDKNQELTEPYGT